MGDSTVDTTLFFSSSSPSPSPGHGIVDARQISTEAILCVSVCLLFFYLFIFFFTRILNAATGGNYLGIRCSLSLSLSSTLFHQVRSSRKGRCPTPERQFRKGNGLNGRTWATAASHPVISLKKQAAVSVTFPHRTHTSSILPVRNILNYLHDPARGDNNARG